MSSFPFFRQLDAMDCGPACLQMVAKYFGKYYSLPTLREKCYITREGVSLMGISDAAETIGFKTLPATLPFENIKKEAPLPLIAHWKQNHFVVVYKCTKKYVHIADPKHGLIKLDDNAFKKGWLSTSAKDVDNGLVLFLEPLPAFYEDEGEKKSKHKLKSFFGYFRHYRKLFLQLYIGITISSILALVFPLLSQSIIDVGIQNRNISFIYLVLFSQLILYSANTVVNFIRGWIFLHMGTRISISIVSDFLIKLLKLPFTFFDNKTIGDLLQRMTDHARIQSFLTSTSLTVVFSIFDFFIFGILLIFYSIKIFSIFIIGSALYFVWNTLFLGWRKTLNYKSFTQASINQSNLVQLLNGIQEIKLQNCERQKRWEWERIQAQQYKLSTEGMKLGQYQQAGAFLIDRVKNIFISFIGAKSVIDGDMTLGMMLSMSYITGQLNGPISQFIGLIYSFQDAKISLERLNDIHVKDDENTDIETVNELPEDKSIYLKNVGFSYGDPKLGKVLKNINLTIKEGQRTAIVGLSGSGKSTLLKLLLKVYQPVEGSIHVGNVNMDLLQNSFWRHNCGIVSQEGYLFSDTIANNISISDERVDKSKLIRAAEISNIKEFVEQLPLRYNTKVGQDGNGISQGQKQRLLIARAVYKDPMYVFLDEATNALDAHNEKEILHKLDEFLKGKTVVMVAHRLSTVRNAHNIIVLRGGEIIEQGNHKQLIEKKGEYYNLVKEQLDI